MPHALLAAALLPLAEASSTWLLPTTVIFIYLAVVLYIGIFAFRRTRTTGEDFFLANRSIGSIVFFLSLFATNMTAFAILGSSGASFKQGIGIFGMMASSSALIIPLTLFFIGTRLWGLGKRFGHMTQVQYFRDRWECSSIGTFYFLLTAVLLLPYLIISIIGGGTILEALTDGHIPFALGGAIVALVVMGNVFFGGMRGAVWVNVFQTILFLAFGLVAFLAIGHDINFAEVVKRISSSPQMKFAMTRDRVPALVFFSFMFIPLSSIMFPHMSIMCLTAKRVSAFRKTVILYPLCIMAIWLPCVYLGAIATAPPTAGHPSIGAAMAGESEIGREWLESKGGHEAGHPAKTTLSELLEKSADPGAKKLLIDVREGKLTQPADLGARLGAVKDPNVGKEVTRIAGTNGDSVLLQMLKFHVPAWLAGLLAAGIISAVMGSDCHQILALSTMFTKDVFDYYGGSKRYGERGTVFVGRGFIIVANLIAYLIALSKPPIFELATSYAFSGFAALSPVMVAAMFWKRSTKWGALASALFVAICVALTGVAEHHFMPGAVIVDFSLWGEAALRLSAPAGKLSVFGFGPVVPMVLGSALLMIVVSLMTKPPTRETIQRYFPKSGAAGAAAGAAA